MQMTDIQPMLEAHPAQSPIDTGVLAGLITELLSCAQHCNICADSCIEEEKVAQMRECIRRNLDCADSCLVTSAQAGRIGRNETNSFRIQVEACMTACRVCAEECEKHADNAEHCRICGEACRHCEQACQKVLDTLG